MAIDKVIYNNGIKGMLSYWEIESLPRDYEVFKAMFKEATDIKQGTRTCFSQDKYQIYEPVRHKPMSRLKQERRMFKVLSSATYGMNKYNCKYIDKISKRQAIDGYDPSKGTEKMTFKSKLDRFIFYLNPKRLWGIISLYWNLRKLWSKDEEAYRKANKTYKKELKELYNKNESIKYNMDSHEWRPFGTC